MKYRNFKHYFITIILIFISGIIFAEEISAVSAVSSRDVFVGESFNFQIQISGTDKVNRPDLSFIKGFNIKNAGESQNNNRSVIINNGRMTQSTHYGYIFNYQFIPIHSGNLIIPSITIHAKGKILQTQPVTITVNKPMETDNFKLRLKLSKTQCYVGEPVTLSIIWYIGQKYDKPEFSLPILSNKSVFITNPKDIPQNGQQYTRGRGNIDNKEYETITFRKILIPKQSGKIKIEPATVSCNAIVGYKKRTHRGFFDDPFFDNFTGQGRQAVYKKIVIPSNPLTLEVSDLPEEGKPSNFIGHIGQYKISSIATPTEVNIGDPITLEITISGAKYLDHIGLIPLNNQPSFSQNFKIPSEISSGKIVGNKKIFTQTIRALRDNIKEIPAIKLPYFDTQTGTYKTARTKPIPLKVKPTKVITALDAEGNTPTIIKGQKLIAWTKGIAYNYTNPGVLINQYYKPGLCLNSPIWISITGIPPAIYFILLSITVIIKRLNANPHATRKRKAYSLLSKRLKNIKSETPDQKVSNIILDTLKNYFADKLQISQAGSLTFGDLHTLLQAKGIDPDTIDTIRNIFNICEAGQYGGSSTGINYKSIINNLYALAKKMEQELK